MGPRQAQCHISQTTVSLGPRLGEGGRDMEVFHISSHPSLLKKASKLGNLGTQAQFSFPVRFLGSELGKRAVFVFPMFLTLKVDPHFLEHYQTHNTFDLNSSENCQKCVLSDGQIDMYIPGLISKLHGG